MFTTQLAIVQLQQSCTLIKPTLTSYILHRSLGRISVPHRLFPPTFSTQKFPQSFSLKSQICMHGHKIAERASFMLKFLVNIAMNTRLHSIITFSQNDQNFVPPLPSCLHFEFGNFPSCKRWNFYITLPPPFNTITQ